MLNNQRELSPQNVSSQCLESQNNNKTITKDGLKNNNQILSSVSHSIIYITIVISFLEIMNKQYGGSATFNYASVLIGNTFLIAIFLISSLCAANKLLCIRTIPIKIISCNGLFWKLQGYFVQKQYDLVQWVMFAFCVLLNLIIIILVDKYIHHLQMVSKLSKMKIDFFQENNSLV